MLGSPRDKENPVNLAADIATMSQSLEEITGLKFHHAVAAAPIDKTALRAFLNGRIDKTIKKSDLHATEVTLKLFGLAPQDFNLRDETVDLLTEQAAAFYDYRKKKLYVVEAETNALRDISLVHELAHALADQNFHLDKYIRENAGGDDGATARMAVTEGQATWLMTAYLQKLAGLPPHVPAAVLAAMANTLQTGAEQYPVFAGAPLYVRESLVFPYVAGLTFQNELYERDGKRSFAEVFERAPDGTQQILHPERYRDGVASVRPEQPKVPPQHLRKLGDGTFGELDMRILLEQYLDKKAADFAARLSGCSYSVWEYKNDGKPVLAVASQWQTPEDARQFFELYRRVLRAKSKTYVESGGASGEVHGALDSGAFSLQLSGAQVRSVEGLRSPLN